MVIEETEERRGLEGVRAQAREKGIEFLLCSFVELTGASKAKVVPIERLDDVHKEGAAFAGFGAGEMGQTPNSPDLTSLPDWNSLAILPWQPNVAWVAGDVHDLEGKPWPYCPRTILRRQIDRALEQGYTFKTGIEAEFFLVRRRPDGSIEPADPLDLLAKPCYDQLTVGRNLDFITTLLKYSAGLGWRPHASDHEDGTCQFELDFQFSDALTSADRYTFCRFLVKSMAEQRGLAATFMPKPFTHLTGTGAHFHQSLWDVTGQMSRFEDPTDPNGLAKIAYWWIGGLRKHARAFAAVTCPTVNSYKRLIRGAPRSGATWAPVYITYGGNNRTQMLRIPGPGRIENRIIDGSCNPYLASAVILAAGLDGIRNRIDPGPRNDRNLYEVPVEELQAEGIELLPRTLSEAIDELERDDIIVDALGADFARMYVRAKRAEWERYHNTVSQWEIDNYLPLF